MDSGTSSTRLPEPLVWPEDAPRWSAGIVNHGSYDDLEICLASLARQDVIPVSIAVYDTGEDPPRLEALRRANPEVDFEQGPNRGYAGGANRVIDRILGRGTQDCGARDGGAQDNRERDGGAGMASIGFVLLLNPDVELEPDFAARLIAEMVARPRVAIAAGKLLRPDRSTIDSAGIVFPRHRRPRDRGSEQPDRGQYDRAELVDAASGAAMMLRVEATADLRLAGELFDEDFFAYHEDTDLCWRARRFGWSILYEPRSVAIHRRGWQRARRAEIPIAIRRHSFKNHYLQLVKNETAGGLLGNLPWILGWEILRLGFVLLRDRPMGRAYLEAGRALPWAWRKRRLVRERARRNEGHGGSAGGRPAGGVKRT
jgi:GT2 family glycosyltransferase